MPRNPVFDPEKPYATTRAVKNKTGAKYVQDGYLFAPTGVCVGRAPGYKEEVKAAPVPQAVKRKSIEDKKKDALAAAADKLNLDTVPKSVKEAAKENAEALAAEEKAE
jgi:hypothetical protein